MILEAFAEVEASGEEFDLLLTSSAILGGAFICKGDNVRNIGRGNCVIL